MVTLFSLSGNPYMHPEWSFIILPCISPEVIRGLYWLELRVDLPVLQLKAETSKHSFEFNITLYLYISRFWVFEQPVE